MKMLSKFLWASLFVFVVAGYATKANVISVFSQDFESGLGGNESTTGNFVINSGMMGHAVNYTNDEYSAYYLSSVDLTSITGSLLAFDYEGEIETNYDFFNVYANGTAISGGDLIPIISGITYTTHTSTSYSPPPQLGTPHPSGLTGHPVSGHAIFDLSAYDGTLLDLIFQFGSDSSVTYPGINFDNVEVSGEDTSLTIPAPGALLLSSLGIGVVGWFRKRKTI